MDRFPSDATILLRSSLFDPLPDTSLECRFFSPQIALEDLSRKLCQKPLASEKDLEDYEKHAVEAEVKDVLQ